MRSAMGIAKCSVAEAIWHACRGRGTRGNVCLGRAGNQNGVSTPMFTHTRTYFIQPPMAVPRSTTWSPLPSTILSPDVFKIPVAILTQVVMV